MKKDNERSRKNKNKRMRKEEYVKRGRNMYGKTQTNYKKSIADLCLNTPQTIYATKRESPI